MVLWWTGWKLDEQDGCNNFQLQNNADPAKSHPSAWVCRACLTPPTSVENSHTHLMKKQNHIWNTSYKGVRRIFRNAFYNKKDNKWIFRINFITWIKFNTCDAELQCPNCLFKLFYEFSYTCLLLGLLLYKIEYWTQVWFQYKIRGKQNLRREMYWKESR